MSDATLVRAAGIDSLTANATIGRHEVFQSPTGKAAVHESSSPVDPTITAELTTSGLFLLEKTAGFVGLKGNRAYWDHSANAVYYKRNSDRDFYLGRFAEDVVSAKNSCIVDLNVDPPYTVDLLRDAYTSIISTSIAVPGAFGYPVQLGGSRVLEIDAQSGSEKVDMLSLGGFDKNYNTIIEGAFRVLDNGTGALIDFSIGFANATHATNPDTITESVFIHLNSNDLNIYAESDDGTIEVAATDTTIDYTVGSALSNRVEFWMDTRDPADVLIYINGSQVLSGSTFVLSSMDGPLFLLAHLVKAVGNDTFKVAVDWLRARVMGNAT